MIAALLLAIGTLPTPLDLPMQDSAPTQRSAAEEAQYAEWELWILSGAAPATLAAGAPAEAQLAWKLAQLARGADPGVQEEEAVQGIVGALLEAWAQDEVPVEWEDFLYARLRGYLQGDAIPQALQMLADPAVPRREDLVALLISWGSDGPDPAIYAFLRDPRQQATYRARLAEAALLSTGRPAFAELESTITAAADVLYLSRVFAGWRQCVMPEDMPLLERLSSELQGIPAQYALQLCALNERDPAARLRIYQQARKAPSNFRQVALDALATQGPDAGIAEALRAELDGIDPDMFSLVLRLLPRFAGPEALWQAYQQRGRTAPPTQRALWMRDLALSPLPQAQQEAADWLAAGGWRGSLGLILARILIASEAIDPVLSTLLGDEQVPDRIRYPLALARAHDAEVARDFLRQALDGRDRLRRGQAIVALAAAAQEQDLQRLARMVQDAALDDHLRALIITAMATLPDAHALVERWQADPPRGYESAAVLVTSLLQSPLAADREWARVFALHPSVDFDLDERRGLRIELWQFLGATASPAEVPFLEQALLTELQHVAAQAKPTVEEVWPHLTQALSEAQELNAILIAYKACLAAVPLEQQVASELRSWDAAGVPPMILTSAAVRMADVAPQLAWHWLDTAEAATALVENRLRIQALRAYLSHGKSGEIAALEALLVDPFELAASPRLLAQGFPIDGATWVLWQDRLLDRLLVAEVRAGKRNPLDLARFFRGSVEASLIDEAIALLGALDGRDSQDVQLLLAATAASREPLSAAAHARFAEIATKHAIAELADKEWQAVLRLTASGSQLSKRAKAALNR